MDSIKKLYKIGHGPSSSHTMGPQIAASTFLKKHPNVQRFVVELYGSLALTGKGHLTDYIIKETLGTERTEIIFNYDKFFDYHPNALEFRAYENDILIDKWLVFSVGGGSLRELNEERQSGNDNVYPHTTMSEILDYCKKLNITLVDYVKKFDDVTPYLEKVLDTMFSTIEIGLYRHDTLPGILHLRRKAHIFYNDYLDYRRYYKILFASALATAEENASGGIIVTSPTCGASGVLPAVLYSHYIHHSTPRKKLIESLMVAGLIGNIIKYNCSISGAEVGCQGEIGSACAMAAAAHALIIGANNYQIEYAAEIALEHNLGLTCDPVEGLVQIPCIERNPLAASKAIDAANYASMTDGIHRVSFDNIIKVMKETGIDLSSKYKETSIGGLASVYRRGC